MVEGEGKGGPLMNGGFIGCHRMIEVSVELQEAGITVPGCEMLGVESLEMKRDFVLWCAHAAANSGKCPLTIQ